MSSRSWRLRSWAVVLLASAGGCASTDLPGRAAPDRAPGDADAGRQVIEDYGCGACHRIPGIRAARGDVGPSLDGIERQKLLAGRLTNTPENLARWIQQPQEVAPGVDMPDLGLTDDEARDAAAYLLTGGATPDE